MISNGQIILRLLLSAFLGGLIGIEREVSNRPAGLRTHVLVTLGSALIMMISIDAFRGMGAGGQGGEPARLAAQVVSGIGFLGAGTILQDGTNIKGLTTAASLWVCGGIGLAIGSGYYLGGITTVVVVLFTLMRLGSIERSIQKNQYKVLVVHGKSRPGVLGAIGTSLGNYNIDIRDVQIIRDDEDDEDEDGKSIEIQLTIKDPNNLPKGELLEIISKIKDIEKVQWKK